MTGSEEKHFNEKKGKKRLGLKPEKARGSKRGGRRSAFTLRNLTSGSYDPNRTRRPNCIQSRKMGEEVGRFVKNLPR